MIPVKNKQIEDALRPLKDRLGNLSPVMSKVAGIMKYAVDQNFMTEGKRLSSKITGSSSGWKKLSPTTIKERQRKGQWPGQILTRHGSSGLRGSITQNYDENSAQVGTNLNYAAIHQFGGEINIGARSEIFERIRYSKGKKKGKFKKLADDRAVKQGLSFKARKIKIPARPFLAVNDDDILKIKKAVADFLVKGK